MDDFEHLTVEIWRGDREVEPQGAIEVGWLVVAAPDKKPRPSGQTGPVCLAPLIRDGPGQRRLVH